MPEPVSPGAARAGGITSGYAPPPGIHDELLSDNGDLRPQWRPFLGHLDSLGPGEMARRWDAASLLIHENGVSYNVYGDPRGMDRPWSLSPIPALVSAADWSTIVLGLQQRALLLDTLLADLFGPQRMLTEGWLPPDLVFGHPSFLRAVHGVPVSRRCWLPFYGADLVRAPDGGFRVIADRTQAPSGAGYTLENRIVVSRALPDLFRACNVERLALFFRSLQETLAELAPHNRDSPRVVLLSPGSNNATYFEQAYLAQYLGYTLVNGGDLTVRDDRVYLKTLSGLQQVDVILRRVNDDFCDPLELRPESVLGVAGLVQAVRQGNVALANPLGSGLLQTAAILPYLPQLSRVLLGEELRLPSAQTWWCGDPNALAEVLSRPGDFVWKPAFPDGFTHPIFAGALSHEDRQGLIDRVRARPSDWVAQEHVHASTTPTLISGKLEPRALVLRGYAVASRGGWTVMPGALSRVADTANNPEVSMQMGAGSKDTWVLAAGPVSTFSLLPPPSHSIELTRGGSDLPSRAADNLFWLGRYAERAEGVARLARVLSTRLQEESATADLDGPSELAALFRSLGAQSELSFTPVTESTAPMERTTLPHAEKQLVAAVLDVDQPGSLAAVVRSTLRIARMVRDRLSGDTWRTLATLADELQPSSDPLKNPVGSLSGLLNRAVLTLAAFSGLSMESMTRGQAWRFLDMGRRLERATTLLLLLRSSLSEPCAREAPLLEAILDIADSGMTYRRRYLANLQVPAVVDLLVTDESNPRSVLFQVKALVEHIEALPTPTGTGVRSPQHRLSLALLAELQLADVDQLSVPDTGGARPQLLSFLERLSLQLPVLSDSLSSTYLNHATIGRHLRSGTEPVLGSG